MSDGSDFSVIWNEIEIERQIDLVYVRDYGIPKIENYLFTILHLIIWRYVKVPKEKSKFHYTDFRCTS